MFYFGVWGNGLVYVCVCTGHVCSCLYLSLTCSVHLVLIWSVNPFRAQEHVSASPAALWYPVDCAQLSCACAAQLGPGKACLSLAGPVSLALSAFSWPAGQAALLEGKFRECVR